MTNKLDFVRTTTGQAVYFPDVPQRFKVEEICWLLDSKLPQCTSYTLFGFISVGKFLDFDLFELPNDWRKYLVDDGEEARSAGQHKHIPGGVHKNVPQFFEVYSRIRQ